jgi:hypothetical protein
MPEPPPPARYRARHGFKRKPDARRAGDERSGTATMPVPAITRCSYSTSLVVWNAMRYVPATCTVPMAGMAYSSRSLRDLTHLFSSGRGLCNARGLRVSGGGADQIRDPATGQPGSAEQDRLFAHAPSRTTSAPCAPVPCQFQLSGRNLDQAAEGYRQGRVASRRTLSPRRLHRDEHEPPGRARRCFLQRARDVRAMDQGRQGRDQVDTAVVQDVRGQTPCGSSFMRSPIILATFSARLQHRSRSKTGR